MTENFQVGMRGLRLEAPEVGDIVTVRVKRRPQQERHHNPAVSFGGLRLFDTEGDEADNPQHYRMTALLRVIAVNGGQAAVEFIGDGYNKGRREVWPIALHEWFEAGDLFEAMQAKSANPA